MIMKSFWVLHSSTYTSLNYVTQSVIQYKVEKASFREITLVQYVYRVHLFMYVRLSLYENSETDVDMFFRPHVTNIYKPHHKCVELEDVPFKDLKIQIYP